MEDDFIVRVEDKKFFITSRFYPNVHAANVVLGDILDMNRITSHIFDCEVCKFEGINNCDVLRNLEGVYNNTKFFLD